MKKKVLFISSTGGHLNELLQLKSLFYNYDYLLVTEKDKSTISLKDKYNVKYLVYGTRKNLFSYFFKFIFNFIKSFLIKRPAILFFKFIISDILFFSLYFNIINFWSLQIVKSSSHSYGNIKSSCSYCNHSKSSTCRSMTVRTN